MVGCRSDGWARRWAAPWRSRWWRPWGGGRSRWAVWVADGPPPELTMPRAVGSSSTVPGRNGRRCERRVGGRGRRRPRRRARSPVRVCTGWVARLGSPTPWMPRVGRRVTPTSTRSTWRRRSQTANGSTCRGGVRRLHREVPVSLVQGRRRPSARSTSTRRRPSSSRSCRGSGRRRRRRSWRTGRSTDGSVRSTSCSRCAGSAKPGWRSCGRRCGSAELSERWVVALAGSALLGAWVARPMPWGLVVVAVGLASVGRRPLVVCVAAVVLASALGARAWDGVLERADVGTGGR